MCSEAKLQEVFFHHGATARQSRKSVVFGCVHLLSDRQDLSMLFCASRTAFWYILAKEMKVLLTNYFEDFIALSPSAVTSCVQHVLQASFTWASAQNLVKKLLNSAPCVHALGVCINVKELHVGVVEIGNTDARRQKLIKFSGYGVGDEASH